MSHWNRAYLDALEVPVWVPLNDQAEENVESPQVEKVQTQSRDDIVSADTEPSKETVARPVEGDYIRYLKGEPSADFVFVIPKDAVQDSCIASLRQLELAWKAWLDLPFTAALAQLSENTEHSQTVESCRGKLIMCGGGQTPIEHPSISAPALDSLQAHKKDWWSLLQRLH
ncbi:hypothetical protein [Kangiella japonica]